MLQRTQHIELAFIVGFALYKAACGCGYLSAMGTVADNIGFVSTITFMVASNIAGIAVCCALVVAGGLFVKVPRLLLGCASYMILLFDFLVIPQWGSSIAIGVFYGLSTGFLSVIWLEICIERTDHAALCVTCGFLLSMLLQYCVFVYEFFSVYISVIPLVVSFCLYAYFVYAEKAPVDKTSYVRFAAHTKSSRIFYPALMCYAVCVFVVGVSNSAVLDTSIESLMGGVDMQAANLLAAILCATLVFCSVKAPSPVKVYIVSLPMFFAIFSLIPILGDNIESRIGFLMVVCYQAIAILFAGFSVHLVHEKRLNPRVVMGMCIGVSNLSLLLGLIMGTVLNIISSNQGLPLPILVAFSAIYPLGVALFYATRKKSESHTRATMQDTVGVNEASAHEPLAFAAVSDAISEVSSDSATGACVSADGNKHMSNQSSIHMQSSVSSEVASTVSGAFECEEDKAGIYKDAEVALITRAQELAALYGLTEREEEILRYLARGRSARKISEELFISENTAWSHIKRIYVKTEMHSRQELLDLFFKK